MTDKYLKKKLQLAAGIPHLPTDLTYECRIAIAGEGERGWEWQDKPHRLVYDLCRQVEADADRIEELVKERKFILDERDRTFALILARAEVSEAKLAKAVEALETLRPVWAQGWSNESMAAQASASALAQLWQMLDASNQTQAVTKLRAVLAELEGEK